MSFKPAAGYGDMFSYTGQNVRGDGFEVRRLAGSVMRQAFSELIFTRFMNASNDAFGVGRGGTFTVPIFKDWGAPGTVIALTAGTAIGIGTQFTDSVTMKMYEYGTGVGYERILNWFTSIAVQAELVKTLGNHVARMINYLDFAVFDGVTRSMEIPASGSYSSILGTVRKGVVATAYGELGQGGLAFLWDQLRTNIVTPLIPERRLYGIVGCANSLRHLKQGSVFQNAALYQNLQAYNYQILGEFGGFVFFETEEQLSKGTMFAFGQNVGGYGFGQPPQIWYYPDYGSDAGRLPVWKVLFYRGQDAIWRDKGTACVRIFSNTAAYNYGTLG